jgi:alpha-tubulin suppressor-like RCC1 family protein
MAIKTQGQTVIYDNEILQTGGGPTANRPVSPVAGMIRFNTDEELFEAFTGTEWVYIDLYKPSGDIFAWGGGANGLLGDGTTVYRSSPVSVIGGFTDWIQVSAGGGLSLGIRSNGTAWAWGPGSNGRLGDGTVVDRSSPVSVIGGFTDWIQVSAGGGHSLGIRSNGTAWAWGYGGFGRLGDGTVVSRSSPVSVVGGFTDWIQVSGGYAFSLGVRSNGTAWAWGRNNTGIPSAVGQLGDNSNTLGRSSPVSVVGGFTDWIQVSAGSFGHSLGVRANGTAWAWGYASQGSLGNGTTFNRSSPVSVIGGFTDWIQVSAGSSHSLGVRANGTAWAWGTPFDGELGDGTVVAKSSPVSVVGGFTDWIQVSARNHSLGIRSNGTAWAWGSGRFGPLGDGTVVSRSSPVSVVGGFTDWIQVSAGGGHSLGLRFTYKK